MSISSLYNVFENIVINARQRKLIFKQAQKHIPWVDRYMNEHPESVKLREAYHQQVTDNEVDTLSVAHFREIISDSFKYSFECFLFIFWKVTSSIDVFFDLGKLFMRVYSIAFFKNTFRFHLLIVLCIFDHLNLLILLWDILEFTSQTVIIIGI